MRIIGKKLQEHLTRLDVADCTIKPIGFFVERLDSVQIVIGRLAD